MKIIELNDIKKVYRNHIVLDGITCDFLQGNTYLLVGVNGSGKSTLLKGILGLIKFNSGKLVFSRQNIAYIPERFSFPAFSTIHSFLNCLLPKKENVPYQILKDWSLYEDRNKLLKNLSKGMAQKVLIIQAMLIKAKVFIFDEPLSGLDHNMQKRFFDEIVRLKNPDTTIIIATHQVDAFKQYANYIYELVDGKINVQINSLSS